MDVADVWESDDEEAVRRTAIKHHDMSEGVCEYRSCASGAVRELSNLVLSQNISSLINILTPHVNVISGHEVGVSRSLLLKMLSTDSAYTRLGNSLCSCRALAEKMHLNSDSSVVMSAELKRFSGFDQGFLGNLDRLFVAGGSAWKIGEIEHAVHSPTTTMEHTSVSPDAWRAIVDSCSVFSPRKTALSITDVKQVKVHFFYVAKQPLMCDLYVGYGDATTKRSFLVVSDPTTQSEFYKCTGAHAQRIGDVLMFDTQQCEEYNGCDIRFMYIFFAYTRLRMADFTIPPFTALMELPADDPNRWNLIDMAAKHINQGRRVCACTRGRSDGTWKSLYTGLGDGIVAFCYERHISTLQTAFEGKSKTCVQQAVVNLAQMYVINCVSKVL